MIRETKFSNEEATSAAKLAELSEDELYQRLSMIFALETTMKIPRRAARLKVRGLESKKFRATRVFTFDIQYHRESGRAYFKRIEKKLFKKICIEKSACKWEKNTLEDVVKLAAALLPLVYSTIAGVSTATIILVTGIIIKRGIRKFCKCPLTTP